VLDVVQQANLDAALDRREQRCEDEASCVGLEPNVVKREVEGVLRRREESRDPPGDIRGPLAAVVERRETDRRVVRGRGAQVDRSDALYARFSA
jgi:hypothetical protein